MHFLAVVRANLGANFVLAVCEFLVSLVFIIVQSAGFYSCRFELLFFVYYFRGFERVKLKKYNKLLKVMDKLTQGFYLRFVASVSYYFVLRLSVLIACPLARR